MAKPEEILQKARKDRKLSQEAVADRLGISPRMYQRYEEGKFPKYKGDKIQQLDQILGTQIYDMIYDTDVPHETLKAEVVNLREKNEILTKHVEFLEKLIMSNLNSIATTQLVTLAEVKAGIKWEAQKMANGDTVTEKALLAAVSKIVGEYMVSFGSNDIGMLASMLSTDNS